MGRYSIPTCQKKLQLSDYCRPASDEPTNTTITYFDGQVVSLYNVHMIMCPCADGLSCDLKTGSCVNFDGLSNFNAIDVNVFSEDWIVNVIFLVFILKLSSSYFCHLFQFSYLFSDVFLFVFIFFVWVEYFQCIYLTSCYKFVQKWHSVFIKGSSSVFKNNLQLECIALFS